jgi:hypothetical protein
MTADKPSPQKESDHNQETGNVDVHQQTTEKFLDDLRWPAGAGKLDRHEPEAAVRGEAAKEKQTTQPGKLEKSAAAANSGAADMLAGFELVDQKPSSLADAVSDQVAHAATKAANLADIGKTLVVGTAEAGWDSLKEAGEVVEAGGKAAARAVESGAAWVSEHPNEAAAIAMAVAAVAVVEISSGGMLTPLLLAKAGTLGGAAMAAVGGLGTVAEAAGVVMTGYQAGKAYRNVNAHGDLGILYNQENYAKAEVERARAGLKEDTGTALFYCATTGIDVSRGLKEAAGASTSIAHGTTDLAGMTPSAHGSLKSAQYLASTDSEFLASGKAAFNAAENVSEGSDYVKEGKEILAKSDSEEEEKAMARRHAI